MTESYHTDFQNMEIPHRFIVIEGPIGVGKTTLARRLAATFNYRPLLEQAEANPFLAEFYQSGRNSAMSTQLFFLFQRSRQMEELKQDDIFNPVRVADFLLEKDRLFAEINLDANEFALYEQVYQQLQPHNPVPDLVIYLQAPVATLQQRIQSRGVGMEQGMPPAYLKQLNEAYSQLFHYYDRSPLLIINAEDIDFAHNDRDYLLLVNYLLGIRSGKHYFNPASIPDIS
jgi:deoxyadenosine/deoxycytidine kinase